MANTVAKFGWPHDFFVSIKTEKDDSVSYIFSVKLFAKDNILINQTVLFELPRLNETMVSLHIYHYT